MILPSGVDFIEFRPNGKEVVVVEDTQDFHRDEGNEEISTDDHEQITWEESCLFRFSKFLGMSPEGYEDEILELMNRIRERKQNEEGKGM